MLLRKLFLPPPPPPPKKEREVDNDGNEIDGITKLFLTVNSKTDVLRTLLHHQSIFRRILIDKAPIVSKDQAEKDFRRERVILNGVVFIPDKINDARSEAFARSLRILVERMLRASSISQKKGSTDWISDIILQRGCRTSAGADSFFLVQKLFCVDGTFVTQKTSLQAEDPIVIDVFTLPDDSLSRTSTSVPLEGDRNMSGKERPISGDPPSSAMLKFTPYEPYLLRRPPSFIYFFFAPFMDQSNHLHNNNYNYNTLSKQLIIHPLNTPQRQP